MDDLYLETERARLRQYRPEDFDRMLELNSDPEVMRYLGGQPGTREEVEGGVARTLLYKEKYGGRLGVFTAELRETGEFMGWFHLRPGRDDLDDTRHLELGYRLKRKFWNRGLATEASSALIDKAFGELGAESVFAQTMKENAPSRRVMEKCGLVFEREFDDPTWGRRTAVYRLTREPFLLRCKDAKK